MSHATIKRIVFFCFVLLVTPLFSPRAHDCIAAETSTLPQDMRMHAHNDYYHKRPLHDALSYGFYSVEADVFSVPNHPNELMIGHVPREIRDGRTLRVLYLDPLKEIIQHNQGSVYGDGRQFSLLVEFKNQALLGMDELEEQLKEYDDLVTSKQGDIITKRAIQVIAYCQDGPPPERDIQRAACKGNFSYLFDASRKDSWMPMIYDDWQTYFRWTGDEPISAQEKTQLYDMIREAHQRGAKLHFFNVASWSSTKAKHRVWQVLLNSGIDYIGSDNLQDLSNFMRAQNHQ